MVDMGKVFDKGEVLRITAVKDSDDLQEKRRKALTRQKVRFSN